MFLSLQTLGVLSQDGMMRFINIHTCKLLFHMGSHDDAITTVAVSPNGRHVVAIMDNGSINVYSIQSLTQELNKVTVSDVQGGKSYLIFLDNVIYVYSYCACVCLLPSPSLLPPRWQ